MKASASCCLLRTLDRSYRRVILHNHEGYSEISTAKRRQYNAVSLATALQDDASSKTAEDRNRCRAKSSSPAWIRRLHNGSVLAVALNYVSQQTPESSETQTKTNKLHLYTSGLDKSLHHLVFSCADNANSGQEFIWAEQECLELGRKGPVFSMLMASSGLLAGESFHTSCCQLMLDVWLRKRLKASLLQHCVPQAGRNVRPCGLTSLTTSHAAPPLWKRVRKTREPTKASLTGHLSVSTTTTIGVPLS